MEAKVSIIIPVYNVQNYLRQCLDTVVGQSYKNIEIILVNDGSTDLSGKICEEYSIKDKRIHVIDQKNQGAANAKNVGLDYATGDYIAFADSDDFVELDWIEEMVYTMEQKNADIVECDFDKVYINKREKGNNASFRAEMFSAEEYMCQYLDNWTCSLFWNKLFKFELIKEIRFRKERRCIDDEFFTYKVVSKATKIYRHEKCLYHYRQRASSVVSSIKNHIQKTDDALEILIERYEWVKKYFPQLIKIYLDHDIEIMIYFAKNGSFTEETVKKFKKISKFYFKESFKHNLGKIGLINVIRMLVISKRYLLREELSDSKSVGEDYFA